jgi:phage I-like protein
MIDTDKLANATVREFVKALNAGDRDAFHAILANGATMSDDGRDRDLADWAEREIFSAAGHMEVESESNDGRSLIADYSNATWGHMRTAWKFTIADGKISRFETGQA